MSIDTTAEFGNQQSQCLSIPHKPEQPHTPHSFPWPTSDNEKGTHKNHKKLCSAVKNRALSNFIKNVFHVSGLQTQLSIMGDEL